MEDGEQKVPVKPGNAVQAQVNGDEVTADEGVEEGGGAGGMGVSLISASHVVLTVNFLPSGALEKSLGKGTLASLPASRLTFPVIM